MVVFKRMVNQMNEDEMLSRITGLLEKGGTMLAIHHDCGAPLFRYRGALVCPVCSLGDTGEMDSMKPNRAGKDQDTPSVQAMRHSVPVISGNLNSTSQSDESDGRSGSTTPPTLDAVSRPGLTGQSSLQENDAMTDVRSALLSRIRKLSIAVEEEQDLYRLRVQLDCLESAIKALRAANGL